MPAIDVASPLHDFGHGLASASGSVLGVTVRCREATYGRDPRTRHRRARRSFLKWVCKHELYGNLQPVVVRHHYRPEIQWIEYHRGPEKYNYGSAYRRGYPDFDASRSTPRDLWEREIEKHIERAKLQRFEAGERRLRALQCRFDPDKRTRRFFKMLHAANALTQ